MGSQKDCIDKVINLFDELSSFRDESVRQISSIILNHNSSIKRGVSNLIKEVGDLREELSIIKEEKGDLQEELSGLKEERTYLLELVQNLNGEIGHLRARSTTSGKDITLVDDSPGEENLDYTECYEEKPMVENEIEVKGDSVVVYGDISEENEEQQNQEFSEITAEDFLCSSCNISFSSQDDLTVHMAKEHSKQDVNAKLRNKRNLSKYKIVGRGEKKKIHQNKQKNKWECDKCFKKWRDQGELRRHIKAVHDKIKDHVCGQCGYATSHKWMLTQHTNTKHHEIRENV